MIVSASWKRTASSLYGKRPVIIKTAPDTVRARHMARAVESDIAVAVVSEQLAAYNARDLERFMATIAPDVLVTNGETGAVMARSKEELRPRYIERFKAEHLHCEVVARVCLGSMVVDREIITGLPQNVVADCLAVYVVDIEADKPHIKTIQLVWKPRSHE